MEAENIKNINYQVIYRNIKYPRIEFKTGRLVLVLPHGENPDKIIDKHKNWIEKKMEFIRESLKNSNGKRISSRTDKELRNIVYSLVKRISDELDVRVNKIYFKRMKTKWASCSPKKNLTVNVLLKYLPENLIEYVIHHEMTHLIEKRHNKRFWDIISRKFNNYEEMEKELFTYWFLIHKLNDTTKF